jgi:hypothetical protein
MKVIFSDARSYLTSIQLTALYRKSKLCIPRNEMCGLVPNSYIYVSVSDLYIPRLGLPHCLQQNRQTNPEYILIAHRHMNVEYR